MNGYTFKGHHFDLEAFDILSKGGQSENVLPCEQITFFKLDSKGFMHEGGKSFWSVHSLKDGAYIKCHVQSSKGSIFLKNRHFFIQERFNKLIYSINTIIRGGIWQLVNFQLVSRFWTGSWQKWNDFYRISELMFTDTIKKINLFQERQTSWNFTDCQVPHFMIVLIPYINLSNLSWIFF